MLKLTEMQKEKLNNLLKVNQKRFPLKPVLVAASGCSSCNGTCKASCGGCSQGCGASNTCPVSIF